MTTTTTRPRRLPVMARAMMQFQAFLLRRNWMGPAGEQLMVITVVGRRTGRRYSTPIGYLRDGDSVIALTNGSEGGSQWYRNLLHTPEVVLEIKGQALRARGEPVRDEAERRRIFALYRRERAANFAQYFGVPASASEAAMEQALASRWFVRFHLLP